MASEREPVTIDDILRAAFDDETSPSATTRAGTVRVPKSGMLAGAATLERLGLTQPPLAPLAQAMQEMDAMGLLEDCERPGEIQHPDLALRYASAAPKCANCKAWSLSHRGWGKCSDAGELTRDLDVCTAWARKT